VPSGDVTVRPVTPSRWEDLEGLFGPNGAYANCWCMWWRMPSREFDEAGGPAKRKALKELTGRREPPGLLAYRNGEAVGWVSVAPRERFGRIERSRVLGRVDDRPVWSIVCFYIPREHRGQGVGRALLDGAVEHVRARGGRLVEAYPIDTRDGRRPSAEIYTGTLGMFEAAGFREVARRGRRPIVRRVVRPRP
jgi:GNAT superfamily N-acetyltransferase